MEFSSEIGAVQRRMAQTQEGVGRRKATFEALNIAVGQQVPVSYTHLTLPTIYSV